MALRSFGKVTVAAAGTPVRATTNETTPTARAGVQSIIVQALSTNLGKIYIGNSAMVKATLVGCYAVLPVPTANILPSFSATVVEAPAGINMNEIFIDADTNGEGVLISATEQ